MKAKPKTTTVIAFSAVLLLACALLPAPTGAAPDQKKDGETADVTVTVKGLSCPFCVRGIEKKLRKVSNVRRVTTELKSGAVGLILEPKKIDLDELRKAVEKAGFTSGGIEVAKGVAVTGAKAES